MPEQDNQARRRVHDTKVKITRLTSLLALTSLLTVAGSNASAAMLGGAATANAGGINGAMTGCNRSNSVPLTTVQDTFALSVSAACFGESSSVDMYANALTAKIGLKASSNPGTDLGAVAYAQVGLIDRWIFSVPASVAPLTFMTIPVSFRFEGTVAPGSTYQPVFGRLMTYGFTISDPQQGFGPLQTFQRLGSITAPGVYLETFSGDLRLIYRGPGLGMLADVDMSLSVPGLQSGSIDFFNTASISLVLPDGVGVTTSSGMPLNFGNSSAVPEPATWMMLASGLLGILISRVNRSRHASTRLP
jgi:hypothetical protein